ncbi:hypothetical protein BsWGS_01323 [Bradybaena similaris]
MSSRSIKMPSSSRRHIKIDMFSQFVSASRLRHVQNILSSRKVGTPDIDGILCIAGIDSHYNEGTYELLNYMLFGFFDARKDELERLGFADEIIDDLMILVGADHVEVYCNPINYNCLLPYVSHWPGIKFHCLTETEYGSGGDTAEEFKIRSFIAMVNNCNIVGFPYSGRVHKIEFDIMGLEKWPIIQAFALDDFNSGGFFTLTHQAVDVSEEVHHLIDYMDPVSVEMLLTEHYPLMVRQWDNMMKYMQMALDSSSPVIDHRKVSEPLSSYFNHGLVGHRRSTGMVPFVVFGPDSEKAKLQTILHGGNVELSDLALKTDHASHMICQAVSPHHPLVCTRTYFFCGHPYSVDAGSKPVSLQHSHVNSELRYSLGIYLSMVKAALAAIETFAHSSSITAAKEKCTCVLQESCFKLGSQSLMDYLSKSSNMEINIDTLSCDDKKDSLNDGNTNTVMKYISIALYDIPVADFSGNTRSLGSMMFGETFLDSRITVAGSTDVSSDYLILTSSTPRHHMWSVTGHARVEQVPQLPVDQWGDILMTDGDIFMIATWTALLSLEKVKLTVYKHGLAIHSSDYGSFALHGSEVSSLSLYDVNSMTEVVTLILEIKLTDVLTDRLPPHLYIACDDSKTSRIVLAFVPHSKSHSQLYGNVLPVWKSGSQFPSVERLDVLNSDLQYLHMYLQCKQNLLETATSLTTRLKRIGSEMPGLFSFLKHLSKSCGFKSPVTREVFHSLTETPVTCENYGDEMIIVTIVAGLPGSGKEALALSLTSLNTTFTNWLVYKQLEECQVDTASLHNTMSAAAQSRDQYLFTKSTRMIIVTPGLCDTADVVRVISFHPDHKLRSQFVIGSVTMCIDPENTFIEHKMTFPMLAGNCAQGWVNSIVLTSQTDASSDLLEDIQALIRSINPDVAILKTVNGTVKRGSDIDLIISEKAFNEPDMETVRVLLKPHWREGYPQTWSCNPPMNEVVLRFTHPLDKHLTIRKLREIKSTLKHHPYDGNIYFVHGNLKFIGSPTPVDIQFTTVAGKLVMNNDKSGQLSGEGTINVMCFTGIGLQEHELKQFLSSCIKQRPDKKPFLTRQDLTNEEIDQVHKLHHLDELPEGWYYNGSRFVSMDGERSLKHPNLEKFLQTYLSNRNAQIEKYNAKVESEVYIKLWEQ